MRKRSLICAVESVIEYVFVKVAYVVDVAVVIIANTTADGDVKMAGVILADEVVEGDEVFQCRRSCIEKKRPKIKIRVTNILKARILHMRLSIPAYLPSTLNSLAGC